MNVVVEPPARPPDASDILSGLHSRYFPLEWLLTPLSPSYIDPLSCIRHVQQPKPARKKGAVLYTVRRNVTSRS
jgi:hypothetical protein